MLVYGPLVQWPLPCTTLVYWFPFAFGAELQLGEEGLNTMFRQER